MRIRFIISLITLALEMEMKDDNNYSVREYKSCNIMQRALLIQIPIKGKYMNVLLKMVIEFVFFFLHKL